MIGTTSSFISVLLFDYFGTSFAILVFSRLGWFDLGDFMYFLFCCRHDQAKAVEILVKDLKVFSTFNEELFKEITLLLTLQNFRYRICMLVNLEGSCCYIEYASIHDFVYFFLWLKNLVVFEKNCVFSTNAELQFAR